LGPLPSATQEKGLFYTKEPYDASPFFFVESMLFSREANDVPERETKNGNLIEHIFIVA
jgi:hypothetical protein